MAAPWLVHPRNEQGWGQGALEHRIDGSVESGWALGDLDAGAMERPSCAKVDPTRMELRLAGPYSTVSLRHRMETTVFCPEDRPL